MGIDRRDFIKGLGATAMGASLLPLANPAAWASPLRSAVVGRAVHGPSPTLLESFDALPPFKASGGVTMTLDTAGRIEGSAQLRLTGSGIQAGAVRITRMRQRVDLDPTTCGPIILRQDLGEDPEYHVFGAGSVSFVDKRDAYLLPPQDRGYQPGELGVRYQILDPSAVPDLVRNGRKPYTFRLLTTQRGHAGGSCWFDGAAFYKPPKGKVCLFLDDMRGTHRSVVLPEMQERGLLGATVFVVPDNMRGSNLRSADLHAMDEYGFEMAVGGTVDDGSLTAKADHAEILRGWAKLRGFITAERFRNPGLGHTVYPNGKSAVPADETLKTPAVSDGSDVLTVDDTGDIRLGYRVASLVVPQTPRTLVKEIVSATQVRVWDGRRPVRVPAGAYRTLFRDVATPFGYGKLWALHRDNGFTFARTAGAPAGGHFMDFEGGGLGRRLNWPNLSISNDYPLATLLENIDDCERNGTFLGIVIHKVETSDVDTLVDVGLTKFRTLLDRIKQGVDRGGLDSVTLNEAEARYFDKGWPES